MTYFIFTSHLANIAKIYANFASIGRSHSFAARYLHVKHFSSLTTQSKPVENVSSGKEEILSSSTQQEFNRSRSLQYKKELTLIKETAHATLRDDIGETKLISFYEYINDPMKNSSLLELRRQLLFDLTRFRVLGRIYIAAEGINGQISCPQSQLDALGKYFPQRTPYTNLLFNEALDHAAYAFRTLHVRIKDKLVNDGLSSQVGGVEPLQVLKELSPEDFHSIITNESLPDSNQAKTDAKSRPLLLFDMRNRYEYEIGRFQNAILPPFETFRESLPWVRDFIHTFLTSNSSTPPPMVAMYCTGGIRCTRTVAYLKSFNIEAHALRGGVINYAKYVKVSGKKSAFIGKNFTFDARLGEKITNDVISQCHSCGSPSDQYINCANQRCHQLIRQCDGCQKKLKHTCSDECLNSLTKDTL